jgi:hypothetical protein
MNRHEDADCTDILLDLVMYEVLSRKLSPEMEDILEKHLKSCASCGRKVLGFRRILRGGDAVCPNFG